MKVYCILLQLILWLVPESDLAIVDFLRLNCCPAIVIIVQHFQINGYQSRKTLTSIETSYITDKITIQTHLLSPLSPY